MKLEKAITFRSYLLFIGFFVFVVIGFWSSYFSKILDQENYRMHTHGISLILWCLMLITQALLIRVKLNSLHKNIGKFSYVLVPLMIFTTIDLMRYSLHQANENHLGPLGFLFVALVMNALFAFVILYGLAIYHRKRTGVHARFMICTIFPMFTPVTDRIMGHYFKPIFPYLYTIEGTPIPMVVGFLLADLILIGLCVWDWSSHRRLNAFPVALIVLLIYHYSVLNFYKFEFWQTFSNWLVN